MQPIIFFYFYIYIYILDKSCNLFKFVSVLLSASVESWCLPYAGFFLSTFGKVTIGTPCGKYNLKRKNVIISLVDLAIFSEDFFGKLGIFMGAFFKLCVPNLSALQHLSLITTLHFSIYCGRETFLLLSTNRNINISPLNKDCFKTKFKGDNCEKGDRFKIFYQHTSSVKQHKLRILQQKTLRSKR